jgi:hypothetical protein
MSTSLHLTVRDEPDLLWRGVASDFNLAQYLGSMWRSWMRVATTYVVPSAKRVQRTSSRRGAVPEHR